MGMQDSRHSGRAESSYTHSTYSIPKKKLFSSLRVVLPVLPVLALYEIPRPSRFLKKVEWVEWVYASVETTPTPAAGVGTGVVLSEIEWVQHQCTRVVHVSSFSEELEWVEWVEWYIPTPALRYPHSSSPQEWVEYLNPHLKSLADHSKAILCIFRVPFYASSYVLFPRSSLFITPAIVNVHVSYPSAPCHVHSLSLSESLILLKRLC